MNPREFYNHPHHMPRLMLDFSSTQSHMICGALVVQLNSYNHHANSARGTKNRRKGAKFADVLHRLTPCFYGLTCGVPDSEQPKSYKPENGAWA